MYIKHYVNSKIIQNRNKCQDYATEKDSMVEEKLSVGEKKSTWSLVKLPSEKK